MFFKYADDKMYYIAIYTYFYFNLAYKLGLIKCIILNGMS